MQKRRKFQSPQRYVQMMALLRSDTAWAAAFTESVSVCQLCTSTHGASLSIEPTVKKYKTTSESRDLYLLPIVNPHGS